MFRSKIIPSIALIGITAGAIYATRLTGLPFEDGSEDVHLMCGDDYLKADVDIDMKDGIAKVTFSGTLNPVRPRTKADFRGFRPNEYMLLRFIDGKGGRIRLFKEKHADKWNAVIMEAKNIGARDLGVCKTI